MRAMRARQAMRMPEAARCERSIRAHAYVACHLRFATTLYHICLILSRSLSRFHVVFMLATPPFSPLIVYFDYAVLPLSFTIYHMPLRHADAI